MPRVRPIGRVILISQSKASVGNWTSLAAKWEQHLTDQLGVTVNIRTPANPVVREYCDALSVPLKR
jgi:hypothetical protein